MTKKQQTQTSIALLNDCNTILQKNINKAKECMKEFSVMHIIYWPGTFVVFNEGQITNDIFECTKYGPKESKAVCNTFKNGDGESPIHCIATTFYQRYIKWAEWQIDNNNEIIESLGGESNVEFIEEEPEVKVLTSTLRSSGLSLNEFKSVLIKLLAIERRINYDYARCRNAEFFWETKHGMKYAERWNTLMTSLRGWSEERYNEGNDLTFKDWLGYCETLNTNPYYTKGDVCA